MKVIKPSVEIEPFDTSKTLKNIEKAGRTCYKSESKITEDSAGKFIKMIIKRGHESVLEHEKITVRVVCDRGVTHEIVRHRLGSYSQESTRYCSYKVPFSYVSLTGPTILFFQENAGSILVIEIRINFYFIPLHLLRFNMLLEVLTTCF